MSVVKGKAHKIPAMASKSCNAVSPRDLYTPLEYIVSTDTTNRTFSVTFKAYCYFGTRINIQNIFHDMTINGTAVPNTTINAWVSADMPGRQIATLTVNGTYNYEGIPSQKEFDVSLFGQMTYYKDVGCTETKEIPFSNQVVFTIPNIEPYYTEPATPTITSVTSLDDALLIDVQTTSFGEGGGKYLFVEASKTSNFATVKTSNKISTLSGTVRISNLQKNTRYYLRAVAANNGMSAIGTTQQNVTLSASEITNMRPASDSAAVATGIVYNGAGYYAPTTKIQVSSDRETWTDVATNISDIAFTKVVDADTGDTLFFRTVTTTTAGTYTSDAYEYTRPESGLWGYVTSIVPSGGTSAVVNFSTGCMSGAATGTIKTKVYYRPYGMEEEWVLAGTHSSANPSAGSVTITGLNPNYAEYEVSLNVTRGQLEYDSDPVQFFTIPVSVHNDTCDSLDYLVQLICQSLNAIRQGNITIYMNDDTKTWCEGEDGVPTLASIMSRINRYMHTVGCLLCSMEGFLELLKEANSTQVFMGKLGWVDCDEEPLDGSVNPVLSKGIYDAIEDLIHQVWHYVGSYDFFAYNPLELNAQSGTAVNQTAVMGNKKYKWNGSSWVEDGTPIMENFGVIHINNGRYEDKAFYWFVNDWNRLDADTEEIEQRLDALEAITTVQWTSISLGSEPCLINLQPYGKTDAEYSALVPTDATRETVILLTEAEPPTDDVDIIVAESTGNYRIGGQQ